VTAAAAWIASILMAVSGHFHSPQHLRCPPHWRDYDGVRPTGEFTCAPPVVGPDWTPGRADLGVQPPARLHLRLRCRPGTKPTVDWDGLGAGCHP